MRSGFIVALLAFGQLAGVAARAAPASPVHHGFALSTPFRPSVVPVGSGVQLAYELHVTNYARQTLTVVRLRALDGRTGAQVASLEGEALAAAVDRVGAADADDRRRVAPGQHVVVYLELPVNADSPPASIHHVIDYQVVGSPERPPASVAGGPVAVGAGALPVFDPPLSGGPWVAVYDPGLKLGHRRYVYAVDGRARIPGRHAVDWMRPSSADGVADDGRGAEVLAVADAVVAATRDGVPEPAPEARRSPVPLGEATGNYVALDLGDGRFAFYEHLMPGLRVRPGDRVRRGQVIGQLGSTGQAQGPHLHFHVADADTPLGAEGLPYVIRGMQAIGRYPSIEAFSGGGAWLPVPSMPPGPRFPAPNAVVRFETAR